MAAGSEVPAPGAMEFGQRCAFLVYFRDFIDLRAKLGNSNASRGETPSPSVALELNLRSAPSHRGSKGRAVVLATSSPGLSAGYPCVPAVLLTLLCFPCSLKCSSTQTAAACLQVSA